jgi:hypothetical protein
VKRKRGAGEKAADPLFNRRKLGELHHRIEKPHLDDAIKARITRLFSANREDDGRLPEAQLDVVAVELRRLLGFDRRRKGGPKVDEIALAKRCLKVACLIVHEGWGIDNELAAIRRVLGDDNFDVTDNRVQQLQRRFDQDRATWLTIARIIPRLDGPRQHQKTIAMPQGQKIHI